MACIQNQTSREKDASSIEELISALRDIQSVDLDKLKLQSGRGSQCRCNAYDEMKLRCEKLEKELNYYKTEDEKLSAVKASADVGIAREKDDVKKKERDCLKQTVEISKVQGMQNTPIAGSTIIPDTSKQNGCATLRQRYTELYDNEWLNAFDLFTRKLCKDDKRAIDCLRRIVMECYKCALYMSQQQLVQAEYILNGSTTKADLYCRKLLKVAQMHFNIKQSDTFHQTFFEKYLTKAIQEEYLTEPDIQTFAANCFQLCWLMSLQDPPAVFAEDPAQGDQFDTSMYHYYTISGDKIDIIVLPALLLHENGPVLVKGIARSYQRTGNLSASTAEKPATNKNSVLKTSRQVSGYPKYPDIETMPTCGSEQEQQVQRDAVLLSKPSKDPMTSQTGGGNYSVFSTMPSAPVEIYASHPTQQYPTQMTDWEWFLFFCQYVNDYDEAHVRSIFGPNFDRYCYYLRYGFPTRVNQ